MKNLLFLVLLLTSSFLTCAQDKNTISIGKVDSIRSKILNEKRQFLVHVPNGGDGLYSKKRYPVAYVLDGDAHFASVVGMIQQLSAVNGNTVVPEMIVVSIRNTDRRRDMTPTHIKDDLPMMDSASSRNTGGGLAFLSFVEKELMPHIDSLYPTAPYKMLIGHSFGGLVVMNALITHPKLFNSYICIDPSMWYDHSNFLKTTKKVLGTQKFAGVSMYLGIANTMNEGLTLTKVVSDTSSDSRHIRSIIELDKFIKANPQIGLRYASKFYPDDTHSSAALITEYDGLRFIFDFNQLKLTGEDFEHNTNALPDKLVKHYANVSKQMGYQILPPEEMVNSMGYEAMQQKHLITAGSFFKMNTINYPKSWNVFDSYGDYFLAKNDKANAIAQFEKSLSLEENPETRKKLDGLQSGK
ncbi:alpha/beta hydrolase [Dyadobacter sp. CY323]|uniref:alpha/beta hydrolase n=1 Tax=Dyadobacter sp. CY323 TaxID=2907302 RepID=UPI001EEA13D1|nr:alpha/beta hydrolase-fold protein [Dyadobacter sp. CY323]MCE6988055.1 alpha/beta hydrolase [Dyadobacter sp. CY323]